MKRIAVDLDGTLCTEVSHSEKFFAEPMQDNIDLINELYYTNRHLIVIYTARGWPELRMTQEWLKKCGVKYHNLIMGKFNYDIIFCDRSVNTKEALLERLNEKH